jgi:hypothetical protein
MRSSIIVWLVNDITTLIEVSTKGLDIASPIYNGGARIERLIVRV